MLLSRTYDAARITGDDSPVRISKLPLKLSRITLSNESQSKAYCHLYDGDDEAMRFIIEPDTRRRLEIFKHPVPFKEGLECRITAEDGSPIVPDADKVVASIAYHHGGARTPQIASGSSEIPSGVSEGHLRNSSFS